MDYTGVGLSLAKKCNLCRIIYLFTIKQTFTKVQKIRPILSIRLVAFGHVFSIHIATAYCLMFMAFDIPDSAHNCTSTFSSTLSSLFFIMSAEKRFFRLESECKKTSFKCRLPLTASYSYSDVAQIFLLTYQLLTQYLCGG